MSLLSTFEDRMSRIFEGSGRGASSPIPLKRFGKLAAKELKKQVIVIEGRDFAPNLYTYLVGPRDNAALAPLYPELTEELARFIESIASERKLGLVTDPLVRFILDPNIKSGSLSLVAEAVTPTVMKDLEREERVFYGLEPRSSRGGQALVDPFPRHADPIPQPAPSAVPGVVPYQPPAALEDSGYDHHSIFDDSYPAVAVRTDGSRGPVLINKVTGESYRLIPPSITIGRDERIADLVLKDSNVSRSHARITEDGGFWTIRDLDSTNGTYVNGSKTREYTLKHGDTIEIGVMELSFQEA